MNTRRFRPTLDSLTSRIAPSGLPATIPVTTPPAETFSTEVILGGGYPTTLHATQVLGEDDQLI